ncbi:hypothetical protein CQ052_02345 [Ochrobactrum sp. MYb15]|nr:hypothetical protein CQZ90_13220 [Ochrobactrum sp. MYb19]PRA57311.1 hypothetical protein CQ062_00675 [Ochrobactrum sp. MYb68]PRA66715.1 hypothetical protein CQ053_05100 [Ochrobactrum sp. MYb18]PRA76256.1 hypothetical protein CQ049_02345 [Brucella thiophenivorans]PRA91725.1 hypothetical protein CQ051_06115 [Ochrobactrum sp. MYb14]PRA98262.1 hypothetical protein CQ052_02345 [Ochrobactrum sp. MYb15]
MLIVERINQAANVLERSTAQVRETGYDNWNGGTRIWTLYLLIGPAEYARLGTNREQLEEQIYNRLVPLIEQFSSDWINVKIAPSIIDQDELHISRNEISQSVRRNIFDGLRLESVSWSGRLDEVEFLQRLYDLKKLPSFDGRFQDASGDIWQHRVNNYDWSDDWVYDDSRLNLLHGSNEGFLRFLCEILHPVVRPDRNEVLKLVKQFNDQLRRDGWHLVEEEFIAGRPRFTAKKIYDTRGRSVSRARTVADALDAAWMQKEIERMEHSVESDPALAIGTAKDLVETCCKTILKRRGVVVSNKADIPDLTKLVAKELRLVPEGISDEAKGAETIRLLLRNLSVLTKYIAELRGLYGSGHGREGKYRGLEARHARLAVGAAVTFIDFITETYHTHEHRSDKQLKDVDT